MSRRAPLPESDPLCRERGGALGKLIVLLTVVAAFSTLGWMLLLPAGVEQAIDGRNGFSTTIGRLALNPFSGHFSGGGVVVTNSADWGGGTFVDVAGFSGELEPLSATREELVVEELAIEITHLVLIIAADGSTNAQAFGDGFALAATLPAPAQAERERGPAVAGLPGWGDGPQRMLVRRLHLKVGKVEVLQPGHPRLPRLAEQLDFEGNYVNVRQWQDLFSVELATRLAQSPALWQALLDSEALPDDAAGGSALQRLLNQAGGALNSLFRTLEQ